MEIRKLTADDALAFRDIRIEMCRNHPEAFGQTPEEVAAIPEQEFRDMLLPRENGPEKFICAALEGGKLVATVAFRREDRQKESHRGWIWSVYVKAEARGKGLSKQLMQSVIEESRTIKGLEMLTLSVAVTQTSARTLYTSLGFFSTGLVLHGYKLADGRYIDFEEMTLWL